MEAIRVLEDTYLAPLPDGRALMVGAPPEALKVLLLWEYPEPAVTVLPPDPLYASGINQASVEFLIFNHLFRMGGARDGVPYYLVCDPGQKERIESLVLDILRGPSDEWMAAHRTPASHRKQLLREMFAVSGGVAEAPLERLTRVVAFEQGRVELPGDLVIRQVGADAVRVECRGKSVQIPRRAQRRATLPLFFADVEEPVIGPRLGLQVIGSASGFTGSEWSSAFIIWINGQPLLVDGTPYLEEHLARLGVEDHHILGYLITHVHEDHANIVGQLVNRRKVTVLTSPPIMASLTTRLAAVLGIDPVDVRRLVDWVPLHPGLDDFGSPLNWYGAEIRTWYSVHTIPTLGVEFRMEEKTIRLPGDTIWGRQLDPFVEHRVISPRRARFIQESYSGADVVVADAGGGPIHPDPDEVRALVEQHSGQVTLVTHIPEYARPYLTPAEPGKGLMLVPRTPRTPEQATALFGSPLLKDVPEQWLLALLYGGNVVDPPEEPAPVQPGAIVVLSGSLAVRQDGEETFRLERGDLFHHSLLPACRTLELRSTATWTRVLSIPEPLYQSLLKATGLQGTLLHLYRTRRWWSGIIGGEPSLDTLVVLSHLCRERSFHPNAEIVRQGDTATHFYVVTAGQVEVTRTEGDTEHVLGQFGPGFFFGEIALLCEERRTATVRALTEVDTLELAGRAFLRNLMDVPHARFLISRAAAERRRRLHETTRDLREG